MTNIRTYAASDIGTLYKNDERSIAEKYGHMIAPYFKINISDTNENVLFSAEALLSEGGYDLNGIIIDNVDFEEDIEGADSISFVVMNPDMEIQNTNLFVEGNNIDVYMGYDGKVPFFMGRGIIVELAPEFSTDSIPTIRVTAYDKSYFMMEEGKAEIIPEGSAWWQRRSARTNTPLNRSNRRGTRTDTNIPSVDEISEEQDAENLRLEESRLDNNRGIEVLQTESIEQSNDDDSYVNEEDQRNRGSERTRSWQRQRFGRRQRNAGKVWRGKTDSEIVAAIFQSYGITPYVEATRERGRRVRSRVRPTRSQPTFIPDEEEDLDEFERQKLLEEQQRLTSFNAYYEEQDRLSRETLDESYGREYIAFNQDARENEYQGVNQIRYATPSEDNNIARRMEEEGIGEDDLNYIDYRIGYDQNTREVRLEDLREDNTTPPTNPNNSRTDGTTRSNQRSVTQKAGTTDWEFIKKLAESHGFILFVFFHIQSMRWIGYWGPEENVPQFRSYIFKYNKGDDSSLGSIRPNISMKNQSSEIDLLYVDPVTRRQNRLRIAMENVNSQFRQFNETGITRYQEPIGNGPEVVLTIHGQRVRVNASHRFRNAEEARQWLIAYWLEHAKDFYILEGETLIGIPEMRAREYHYIEGIGRYDGKFFITQATHSMSSGNIYSTSFVGRKALDMRANEDPGNDMLVVDQQTLGENEAGEIEATETGLTSNPVVEI